MNKIPKPIIKFGLYPYTYAVDDIASANGMDEFAKSSLMFEMAEAIIQGRLQVRKPETGAPFTDKADPPAYVSIDDVNKWIEARGFPYKWVPTTTTTTRPQQQQQFQEVTILQTITDLGYSPTALPKPKPGKNGIKSMVRKKLNLSKGVFDKAWERLRADGRIDNV